MIYPHWNYFVTLVEDLEEASRYVDISEDNYGTYSTEFARLILAACSEIDVVAKLLCQQIEPTRKVKSITDYCEIITGKFSHFQSIEVVIPRHSVSLTPWEGWNPKKKPDWWAHYNGIKHERNVHFKEANLKNTIYSIAGLAVILSYFHHHELSENRFNPIPRFLFIANRYSTGKVMLGQPMYHLPDFPRKDPLGRKPG